MVEEFFKFVEIGDLENVKKCIKEKNFNPAVNNHAIGWASKNGHLNIVKYLMSLDNRYKIDPSSNNNRAIRYASEYGHLAFQVRWFPP